MLKKFDQLFDSIVSEARVSKAARAKEIEDKLVEIFESHGKNRDKRMYAPGQVNLIVEVEDSYRAKHRYPIMPKVVFCQNADFKYNSDYEKTGIYGDRIPVIGFKDIIGVWDLDAIEKEEPVEVGSIEELGALAPSHRLAKLKTNVLTGFGHDSSNVVQLDKVIPLYEDFEAEEDSGVPGSKFWKCLVWSKYFSMNSIDEWCFASFGSGAVLPPDTPLS